ncbi:RNA-binding domain-containing protein, partial [Rhizodiscina lignyota]
MAPDKNRVVFVGNIPYGVSEDILMETLGRVGHVVNFRLVHDKDTGKPKGFGFAEYADPDSAASAVRNLNEHELMGRKLRVDWSNDGGSNESSGQNAPSNHPAVNGQDAPQVQQSSALPPLPPGADLPPNISCPDAISRTLRALPPPQLLDILSQMKGLVMSNPAQAIELFRQAPQISYAMFQSLLLLGLVETSVLHSILQQEA